VIRLSRLDAKDTALYARPQNEPCTSDIPVHTRCVVHSSSVTQDKRKLIEKYFIGLFCIFQIYIGEIIETAQMICLHIARPKSDRRYLGCVVIS